MKNKNYVAGGAATAQKPKTWDLVFNGQVIISNKPYAMCQKERKNRGGMHDGRYKIVFHG